MGQLREEGRMRPAGEQAYALRTASKSRVYSHERETPAEFSDGEIDAFKRDAAAWRFFDATPPSYKRRVMHWIVSAKKDATRATRLATLMQACANGVRLK